MEGEGMLDKLDYLCELLYVRKAVPQDYLGGPNAKFIGDCIIKIKALLSELDRLREENEELKEQLHQAEIDNNLWRDK